MKSEHVNSGDTFNKPALSDELRARYRALMKKQDDGTFDKDDALEFMVTISTLGRIGFKLNQDESDWVKK